MHETGRTEVAATAAADGQLLASIVASLPDATFAIDAQKRIVAWNPACEALTGVRGDVLARGTTPTPSPSLVRDGRR